MSDASEFQNRINQLRTELQGKVSEFQSKISEVQSKLSELPSKMGAHVEERVASIFEDIDPEATPHAYSVKAAGNTVLDLIDGLVHAVAAIEKDLAAREAAVRTPLPNGTSPGSNRTIVDAAVDGTLTEERLADLIAEAAQLQQRATYADRAVHAQRRTGRARFDSPRRAARR